MYVSNVMFLKVINIMFNVCSNYRFSSHSSNEVINNPKVEKKEKVENKKRLHMFRIR